MNNIKPAAEQAVLLKIKNNFVLGYEEKAA